MSTSIFIIKEEKHTKLFWNKITQEFNKSKDKATNFPSLGEAHDEYLNLLSRPELKNKCLMVNYKNTDFE